MAMLRVSTVKQWASMMNPTSNYWLRYNVDMKTDRVTTVYCQVCREQKEKLKALRNFNLAFITGISGSALKKDNVVKHSKSDMHCKAINIWKKPQSVEDIYKSTPIGRAMSSASNEEKTRVSKLVDLVYVVANQEMPFSKYPALIELEKRHGVQLGDTYTTEHKCSELTCLIGLTMRDSVLTSLKQARYFSLLIDGSTDSSITEKEQTYVKFVDSNGEVKCHFLSLNNVPDGTAQGLRTGMDKTLTNLDIADYKERFVAFCADGASVNMGVHHGLVALLQEDMPWMVAIHCLNHRLELAAKDAIKNSYMTDVTDMLMNLYYIYHKSPKRLRELRAVADAMEEKISKPDKAQGTRWVQHKARALQTLINGYLVLVAHIEAQAAAYGCKAEAARFKTYLVKLTSLKFVFHMLFFHMLLQPLAAVSCHLQENSVDLLFAIASFESFHTAIDKLSVEGWGNPETSELSKLMSLDAESTFKGIQLSGNKIAIVSAFKTSILSYGQKLKSCVYDRLKDLEERDIFKALKLLEIGTWPKNKEALDIFGHQELSLLCDHFNTILLKNEVDYIYNLPRLSGMHLRISAAGTCYTSQKKRSGHYLSLIIG